MGASWLKAWMVSSWKSWLNIAKTANLGQLAINLWWSDRVEEGFTKEEEVLWVMEGDSGKQWAVRVTTRCYIVPKRYSRNPSLTSIINLSELAKYAGRWHPELVQGCVPHGHILEWKPSTVNISLANSIGRACRLGWHCSTCCQLSTNNAFLLKHLSFHYYWNTTDRKRHKKGELQRLWTYVALKTKWIKLNRKGVKKTVGGWGGERLPRTVKAVLSYFERDSVRAWTVCFQALEANRSCSAIKHPRNLSACHTIMAAQWAALRHFCILAAALIHASFLRSRRSGLIYHF